MKVKEISVPRSDATRIFTVIEEELSTNPNTQVFVDYRIYKDLRVNHWDYGISLPNIVKGFHYYHDSDNSGGEDWLVLNGNQSYTDGCGCFHAHEVARGSFIYNCKDYMQLVDFKSAKVDSYTHYLMGFEQLLLIQFET